MVGLGAIAFFTLLALLLVVVGQGLGQFVGFDTLTGRLLRGVVGGFLVLLGLLQARLIRTRVGVFDAVAGSAVRAFGTSHVIDRRARNFTYGFSYVLVGFG